MATVSINGFRGDTIANTSFAMLVWLVVLARVCFSWTGNGGTRPSTVDGTMRIYYA
jgi:hypothetical protein